MKKKNTAPVVAATTPITGQAAHAMAAKGALTIIDLFNAAQLLSDEGKPDEAIALYQSWLANTASPLAYAVHFNLAVSLAGAKDDAGAERHYRESIAQKGDFAEAYLNLGTLLERSGRPDEALDTWRKVLTFIDNKDTTGFYTQALNNLGRLLEIQRRYSEAEDMLQQSLLHTPKQPNVITHFVHLRQKQCKWPVYFDFGQVTVADMLHSTSALAMLSVSNDPEVQLDASRRFVEEKVLSGVEPLANPDGYRHERLRIGYLSSDLHSHAVSILTAELYELHDRSKVEVYAFSWSTEDGSPLRARVVGAMDHYIPIAAMTDEEAAKCIRACEIDILVDLHGLTLGTRPNILSYRAAPVQMTYLGFPGPCGMPSIDYVVADEFLIPPELAQRFTEKPLYMPHCFQINDRQRLIAPTPTKQACGLPEDKFVFCSFNNNFKFTEEMFAAWMRILTRVPDSVLWLVSDHDVVRTNLRKYAQDHGVDPDRLFFAPRAVPAEYLARYQVADLFLDTFPFNAGTTASDALWAGLPLLTYTGKVFAARMAGSLLRAVDLPELITYSLQDYEDKAVALANDRPRIEAMKQQLVQNRLSCKLFDSPQFVRDYEALLDTVAKGERIPVSHAVAMAPAASPPGVAVTQLASPPALAQPHRFNGLPLVSIVIPTYKAAHFEQCLKSAIGQTYPHIEILVSDNCPTEDIKNICAKYPNVIYQRSNVYRTDNVISSLYAAKGELIKPLFDDDILHPFCVERMVSVMLPRPDVELAFSASQVISIDNLRTEERRPYQASGSLSGIEMQRSMALRFCNFVGEFSTVMFRRQKIWDLGWRQLFVIGQHDFTRGLADVAMYCNLTRDGAAFYIDEELSYFRSDQRLMSNSNISSNPDFGFCFSDYIDLALVSHQGGLITTAELLGLSMQVDSTVAKLRNLFYQVGQAQERYHRYVGALTAPAPASQLE